MPLFEIEVGAHPNTLVTPGLDPGIHPSSQDVHSKNPPSLFELRRTGMDCRVKPGMTF
jgi:hypothetical protein